MVSIFKTNIQEDDQAKAVLKVLKNIFPHYRINFDLDDREKILRIESPVVHSEIIISVMDSLGFGCKELEDKVCLGKENKKRTGNV